MVSFIDEHRGQYGVESLCAILPIDPSFCYEHRARQAGRRPVASRRRRDAQLVGEIQRVRRSNFGAYGARKLWLQLRREDTSVAHGTVARLMKSTGLQGVRRGRRCRTTIPDEGAIRPADLVEHRFRADRPNQLWIEQAYHRVSQSGLTQTRRSLGNLG